MKEQRRLRRGDRVGCHQVRRYPDGEVATIYRFQWDECFEPLPRK